MGKELTSFIDSGKKIKIRADKIMSTLISSEFTGTLNIHINRKTEPVVFLNNRIFTLFTPQKLAEVLENAIFSLASSTETSDEDGLTEWNPMEYLYRIIENIDKKKLIKYMGDSIADYLTIKPEASQLEFISNELKIFHGRDKVQILPHFQKNYRTIYFLLISRYAAIIPSPPEEKEVILERAQNIIREGDGYKKEAKALQPEDRMSKEEAVVNFLNTREKYRDVFHLFNISFKMGDVDDKTLQKEYMDIVKKTHPDRLIDISEGTKKRAENFFLAASEAYEMLKDVEIRENIIKLMKRYQPIRNRTDYIRLKEYDDAVFKGTALERLGQYSAAKTVYDEIFKQTKAPDALERKILAHWKMKPKWNEDEKRINYVEIKEDIEKLKELWDPALEVLYILVEILEFFGQIPDCLKVINMIIKFYPEDDRAEALKKRILYYDGLKKKKKK